MPQRTPLSRGGAIGIETPGVRPKRMPTAPVAGLMASMPPAPPQLPMPEPFAAPSEDEMLAFMRTDADQDTMGRFHQTLGINTGQRPFGR